MATIDATAITDTVPHSRGTRMLHAGLALSVIVQLLSSLAMQPPAPDHAGNVLFQLHQYSGLAAFLFVVGVWVAVAIRRRGTAPGLLFPWLSGTRRIALWDDTLAHLRRLKSMRLPPFVEHAPLASAIHGLGLLLMSAMATSGTLYYLINTGNPDAGGLVGATMLVHRTLANLVWAYLIGHAGIAVLHHFTSHQSLRDMWSFGRDPNSGA